MDVGGDENIHTINVGMKGYLLLNLESEGQMSWPWKLPWTNVFPMCTKFVKNYSKSSFNIILTTNNKHEGQHKVCKEIP